MVDEVVMGVVLGWLGGGGDNGGGVGSGWLMMTIMGGGYVGLWRLDIVEDGT